MGKISAWLARRWQAASRGLQKAKARWGKGRLIAAGAVGAALLIFLIAVVAGQSALPGPAAILARTALERVVKADGLVESAAKAEVYAPSSLRVLRIYVQEGDKVAAGDLLAELDTEALALEIRRAELSIQSAEASLSGEQRALETTIANARESESAAAIDARAARREYETLLARRGQEPAVVAAAVNLDTARRIRDDNQALFAAGGVSRETATQSEEALQKAEAAYQDATRGASDALERAREALDTAEVRHKSAVVTLDDALKRDTDPAAAALALQRVALEEKRIRLRDAAITAPAGGRVTLVNAKQGAAASGLLVVIEDDELLIVRARVEESDLAGVAIGADCRIQAGGREDTLAGVVTKIAAAAERETDGAFSALSGDDVYFSVELAIEAPPAGVLIGMNAAVELIADRREDCFAAPRELIYREEDGGAYVLTRRLTGLARVPVETGLTTGAGLTEIAGEGLYEGLALYKG
ncbi:MAG: HlyD family secretion protein [Peptococcaceae bacterium]|jgi:HlyD family secretion protein|nr:HlyD family secretion protein [Peptococcaceae bacterium]